jgi:hypothetical protein
MESQEYGGFVETVSMCSQELPEEYYPKKYLATECTEISEFCG